VTTDARTCSICRQKKPGTIALGGEFVCWDCDELFERANARAAGRQIAEQIKAQIETGKDLE